MSTRTERIGSLIRRIIAEALQRRLNDPRIPVITSITRVEVSADLSVARVMVSVMAPEKERQECLRALRSAAGYLRKLLGPELKMRKSPTLAFRLDDSVRGSFETVQLIDRVMEDLGEGLERERPATAGTDLAPTDGADAAERAPGEDESGQEDS